MSCIDTIKVIEWIDHPDGSATMHVEMQPDAIRVFASIGLLSVLLDAANQTLADDVQFNQEKQLDDQLNNTPTAV